MKKCYILHDSISKENFAVAPHGDVYVVIEEGNSILDLGQEVLPKLYKQVIQFDIKQKTEFIHNYVNKKS